MSDRKDFEMIVNYENQIKILEKKNKEQFDLGYKYGVKESIERVKLLEADVNSLSRVIERKEYKLLEAEKVIELMLPELYWLFYQATGEYIYKTTEQGCKPKISYDKAREYQNKYKSEK